MRLNPLDMPDSHFELAVPEPFRFAACLAYLSRSPLECMYEIANGRIIRLLRLGTKRMLIEISSSHSRTLRVRSLHPPSPGQDAMQEAARFVTEWFDLERDLVPFYRLAETSEVLRGLIEAFYGLRLLGIPDLFEALCWAVMGQQVNLTFAYTLKRRLTELYGDQLEWHGRMFRSFPLPERILEAGQEELRRLQLTKVKAAAIVHIAGLAASGQLSRDMLLSLGSFEAAGQKLMQIRGIGPWTAQYVGMRCLRDPRAFPTADVGLQNAVKLQLHLPRKPTPEELRTLFSRWQGWEAYATFYFWRSLY